MDKSQFDKLNDRSYNRIPVWRSVLADLDTLLSENLTLCDGRDSHLFESIEVGERDVGDRKIKTAFLNNRPSISGAE